MLPLITGIIYGRDEGKYLEKSLRSMLNQTHTFNRIIYVDDCSVDNSVETAENLDVEIIMLQTRHESWAGTPKLAHLPNKAIFHVHREEYFLINGADITLAKNYVETLLELMKRNPQVVLASGIIEGEPWRENVPKGAGRIHQTRFWRRHVGYYPYMYAWESYPIYKALSLGYRTVCTDKTSMKALRTTVRVKANWGYGLKQLGYKLPNVLARCLANIQYEPLESLRMLARYLSCSFKVYDEQVAEYLRDKQGPPWQSFRNLIMSMTLRQAREFLHRVQGRPL